MARPSSRSPERRVLVAGAGPMGREHVRALLALGCAPGEIEVVARGEERPRALARELGVRWRAGGVETLEDPLPAAAAIVAVGVPELAGAALALVERGCAGVLLEKPGALHRRELEQLAAAAAARDARVFVAFNRRFYPSVDAARRILAEDGGALSAAFDFTEIEERVLAAQREERLADEVLARWGLVNSTHVIDLFSHLAGTPERWSQERSGSLPWHPAGALFSGSGVTDRGALFSYLATWAGAGRWGLEVTTRERKLVLRPLEELRVQRKGRLELEQVELDGEPAGLKPGLYGQLGAFLACAGGGVPDPRLCSLDEALAVFDLACGIFGYA